MARRDTQRQLRLFGVGDLGPPDEDGREAGSDSSNYERWEEVFSTWGDSSQRRGLRTTWLTGSVGRASPVMGSRSCGVLTDSVQAGRWISCSLAPARWLPDGSGIAYCTTALSGKSLMQVMNMVRKSLALSLPPPLAGRGRGLPSAS